MKRMTQRNYYGMPFVPGYAPQCRDPATCELIVKLTERVAFFEDAWGELKETIQELHGNNADKPDVENVTRFLVNLMNVLEEKEK